MNISQLVSKLGKTVNDNSPLILTGIGVAGTITTALLAGKASFKAERWIHALEFEAQVDPNGYEARTVFVRELSLKEKLQLVWPLYVPAVTTGALTITAVIVANRIGTRRAAAVAAAYTLSQETFQEYREKIIEKIGESKERQAHDEIAQERVNRQPVSAEQVIITGDGDYLCYDNYSKRYFRSTKQKLQRAEIEIKTTIINHDSASLNEFYAAINLPGTKFGEDVGWSNLETLDLVFTTVLSENDIPCLVVDFRNDPAPNYFRLH